MVSVLGDYYYNFPNPIGCELRLKDMLEQNVNEKYYLSAETIDRIMHWNAQQDPLKDIDKEKAISPCITARGAGEEHSGMILINEKATKKDFKLYDYYNKREIDNKQVGTITTGCATNGSGTFLVEEPRIRKLTPRECFRLMGVKDEDFDKIAKNQSDSSLYHLAGDSIITNCLMAIFKEMI